MIGLKIEEYREPNLRITTDPSRIRRRSRILAFYVQVLNHCGAERCGQNDVCPRVYFEARRNRSIYQRGFDCQRTFAASARLAALAALAAGRLFLQDLDRLAGEWVAAHG
jgi:hypothetical protein